MDKITDWIKEFTELSPEIQGKIFTSLIVIIILWLIRIVVIRMVWQVNNSPGTKLEKRDRREAYPRRPPARISQ